jgi:hypothetical protein
MRLVSGSIDQAMAQVTHINKLFSSLPEKCAPISSCGNMIAEFFAKPGAVGFILHTDKAQPVTVIDSEVFKILTSGFQTLPPILKEIQSRNQVVQTACEMIQKAHNTIGMQIGLLLTTIVVSGLALALILKKEPQGNQQNPNVANSSFSKPSVAVLKAAVGFEILLSGVSLFAIFRASQDLSKAHAMLRTLV